MSDNIVISPQDNNISLSVDNNIIVITDSDQNNIIVTQPNNNIVEVTLPPNTNDITQTENIVVINDPSSNQVNVTDQSLKVIQLTTYGFQGPPGPPGTGSFDTGSLVTTSSFNAFTSSYNTGSFSGSFIGTSSYSNQSLSSSYALTASFALNGGGGGSTNTGSLLTTASVNLNTITFTKGDGSTFPITVNTGSGGGGSGSSFPYTGSAGISGSLDLNGPLNASPQNFNIDNSNFVQNAVFNGSSINLNTYSNQVFTINRQWINSGLYTSSITSGSTFNAYSSQESQTSIGTKLFYSGSQSDSYNIPGYKFLGIVIGTSSFESGDPSTTTNVVTASAYITTSSLNVNTHIRFYNLGVGTGSGAINLNGNINISGSTIIRGTTSISSSLNVSNSITSPLYLASGSIFVGPLTITGSASINNTLIFTSSLINRYISVDPNRYTASQKFITLGKIEGYVETGGGLFSDTNFITLVRNASEFNQNFDPYGSLHTRIQFVKGWYYNADDTNYNITNTASRLDFVTDNIHRNITDIQYVGQGYDSGNNLLPAKGFNTNYNGTSYFNITGSLGIQVTGSGNLFLITSQSNTLFQVNTNDTGNLFEVNSAVNPLGIPIFSVSSSYQSVFGGPVSGSFTGSLLGTASFARSASNSSFATNAFSATSASFAQTVANLPANIVTNPFTGSFLITGSLTLTGSLNTTGDINGVYISEGSGSRTTNLVVGDSNSLATISGTGTSGQNLIAIGSGSLISATTTFRNIALGNNIMPLVTTNGSNNNIGIGFDVLTLGTTSLTNNIAVGNSASFGTTSGDNNIAIGTEALFSNTTQNNNIAVGLRAGKLATGAAASIFIGTDAGANVTSGDNNIAIGFEALKFLTTVNNNIAIGFQAMVSGSGAADSIAIGANTLSKITTGDFNLAIGANALATITTANGNLAIGTSAMVSSSATLSSNNTTVGYQSLQQITGSNNVAFGYNTMQGFRSGSNNTVIGYNNISGSGVSGSNNTIIGGNIVLADGAYNNRIIIADGQGTQRISVSGSITTISGSLTATSFTGSFTGSIIATGSLTGSFTGSIIATGSLTGSFTGSIFATGRVSQTVGALSIVSSTASLDLSRGNFFTLTLAASAVTHINPTNITAGQTTTVLITTAAGSDVTFPSSVKQQSGSAYVTSPSVAKDILTFISYDTSNVYVANVKNLI